MILSADEESFAREVLHADRPTMVEFSAPWCGYCHRLRPLLEQMAEKGRRIVQVDVERAPALAARYGVRSVPALLYFSGGQHGALLTGPDSAAAIEHWLAAQGQGR